MRILVIVICLWAVAFGTLSAPVAATARAQQSSPQPVWSYPIGTPGKALGDGFLVRHGYATENTWYNPNWWHTGEDWYAQEGDTAGAHVYAVAAGTVVYAGANYPGRVVIVRHNGDLFSMYGHLDPALNVRVGQQVARGEPIGTVLRRNDRVPNHLHFEIRTFLTTRVVNGAAPRYRYRCGVNCPPGPGYWPIRDRQHPSALGWRNPTHVIAGRAGAPATPAPLGDVIVASQPPTTTVALWSAPPNDTRRQQQERLTIRAGQRLPLLAIWSGAEDSTATGAEGYAVWYKVGLAGNRSGWVQAAQPAAVDTGSDGRPSSVVFTFLPAVLAPSS